MSDISVSWIVISRSPLRERLQAGALGLTAGVIAALVLALWFRSEAAAVAGGLAAACTAVLMGRSFARARDPGTWCVRPDGSVSIRWGAGGASDDVKAAFVSSFLIVLRHGTRTLEVWRDATPAAAFRRLSVAIHWRVARKISAVPG